MITLYHDPLPLSSFYIETMVLGVAPPASTTPLTTHTATELEVNNHRHSAVKHNLPTSRAAPGPLSFRVFLGQAESLPATIDTPPAPMALPYPVVIQCKAISRTPHVALHVRHGITPHRGKRIVSLSNSRLTASAASVTSRVPCSSGETPACLLRSRAA